jgi:hypothetical protein
METNDLVAVLTISVIAAILVGYLILQKKK